MTEHLPECWAKDPSDPPAWCICDELRACEDRVARAFQVVRKDDTRKWKEFSLDQFDAGFSEGLDAAIREAVSALPEYQMRDTCIAAIEALRREHDEAG